MRRTNQTSNTCSITELRTISIPLNSGGTKESRPPCGGGGGDVAGRMGAEEQRECATAIDARQLHQAESM